MVRIQAPATTANLGAGFDCLGCALSLYNTYEIEEIERGYEITGCGAAYANEENLVARAYREAMRRMNLPVRGLHRGGRIGRVAPARRAHGRAGAAGRGHRHRGASG